MIRLLLIVLCSFISAVAFTQTSTSLGGKVTDEETGEAIAFGSVVLFKNGVLITGELTDENGNYLFSNIDPGTYDLEASYTGYSTKRITSVQILAGRSNKADVKLAAGIMLGEVVVTEYKVPLVQQDNTTSGGVITSDQIRNLPTRNINAIAATTAGLSSADEGSAITIRGSRSDATNYYIDGIRVQGNLIPESEIDQLQVITGGVEAQYGDVTGGIISITTKGPSNVFSGGVEVETSNFLDAYDNTLIGFNLTGPLLRNKRKESILGFRLSGRITDQLDDDPSAVPLYRIKEEKLKELEANPIINIGGNPFLAADFLTQEDVDALDVRPYEDYRRYSLTGRLDARLSRAIDVSFTGNYSDETDRFTPGVLGGPRTAQGNINNWRLLNSHYNPTNPSKVYQGIFRFRHRLGGTEGSNDSTGRRSNFIRNVSYTLQGGYEKNLNDFYDTRHQDNLFDYGYVGKFDMEWIPTFSTQFDPVNGQFYLQHTDYRQVLRGYTSGSVNPVLANYNNAMGINFNEGLNGQIGSYLVTDAGGGGTSILQQNAFIAPNGEISDVYTNSWGFNANVGTVYNFYGKSDDDIYTFNANASFDLVPGSSNKSRHSIQLGVWYEQRTNRSYQISPRNLWNVARQQANIHIQGIPENADTIGSINVEGYGEVPLLGVATAPGEDSRFYRRIREITGQSLTDFVNVDALSPDQLSLDLFSAKELNDQQSLGLNYIGYDYLGNNFDGTFDDFFTATDADGVRTFPVSPNRPIYTAAYIQDKFTLGDIIFRVGVRIDRYDANTKVLKDNYSLYEIMGASDYHAQAGSQRPGNIGDDYKVYLDESGSAVVGYRNEDQWYSSNGTPVNNPATLFPGGLVFPKYVDERPARDLNFIKSRNFDPNVSFEDYEAQINIMPRLAFSFPISDDANFFAHYDILVQRPPSNTIASPRDYFYFADVAYSAGNPINNPKLKPERTIDYEVGFQQKLTESSAIKITAYYKELRDMIQLRTFFPVPIVGQYTTYDNQDFGTVKGFTFQYDLRRTGNLALTANYTLQFADGTGSDANSQRNLTSNGNLRTLFPLNYDERHRFVANFDYRYGTGKRYNGPRLFGSDIFADAGLNLQAFLVSGRPYTARLTPIELGGLGTVGSINGARKPWNLTLNLRVDKNFTIAEKYNFNVYCRVSNLLDRRNVINVYQVTGSATDDGFLQSVNGRRQLENIQGSVRQVESYLASYQWALLNPNLFSLPRRIFIGAIMDF